MCGGSHRKFQRPGLEIAHSLHHSSHWPDSTKWPQPTAGRLGGVGRSVVWPGEKENRSVVSLGHTDAKVKMSDGEN